MVVVQNICTSLFNSHLFDFHQGWMYGLVGVVSPAGWGFAHERNAETAACIPSPEPESMQRHPAPNARTPARRCNINNSASTRSLKLRSSASRAPSQAPVIVAGNAINASEYRRPA